MDSDYNIGSAQAFYVGSTAHQACLSAYYVLNQHWEKNRYGVSRFSAISLGSGFTSIGKDIGG